MKGKKLLCGLLSCVMLLGCFSVANAAEVDTGAARLEELPYSVVELASVEHRDSNKAVGRATGSVNLTLTARELVAAGSAFQMDKDQTVTIKCSYLPSSASVDFGLIDANGKFHYVSGSNGSVNKSIKITTRGQYTFAIRNNAGVSVTVEGRITY